MTSVEVNSRKHASPPTTKRRGTNASTTSEDDIGEINEMAISVDGASPKPATINKPPSSEARLTSLRSLLGIPTQSSNVAPGAKRAGMLAVPPTTTAKTAPLGVGGASGARLNVDEDGRATLKSEIAPKRKKVVLEPGCSALDWAVKKSEMAEERSRRPDGMRVQRITPSELKRHNSREDAWSAFNGKVYDITPYLRFHPGGVQELLRVAGRDGTRLFMLTHSWVNIDAMIDACCVGILVSEP